MSHRYTLLYLFMLLGLWSRSQYMNDKSIIDAYSINHCAKLGDDVDLAISPDGNYTTYSIMNLPSEKSTLIIRSTFGNWCDSFVNASKICFSKDSRFFLVQKEDTLFRILLGSNKIEKLSRIKSIIKPYKNSLQWIALKFNNLGGISLFNCSSGRLIHYEKFSNCYFNENAESIYFSFEKVENGDTITQISLLLLSNLKETRIFQNRQTEINNLVVYKTGGQIVFATREIKDKEAKFSLWYYKKDQNIIRKIISDVTDSICEVEFRQDGKFIFFKKSVKIEPFKFNYGAKVNVWNYLDDRSQQWQEVNKDIIDAKSTFAVNISDSFDFKKDPVQITSWNEQMAFYNTNGNFVTVAKIFNQEREWLNYRDSLFLVSLIDGSRKLLPVNRGAFLSPSGDYIVYYDRKKQHYFSYDINKDTYVNISSNLNPGQLAKVDEFIKVIDSNYIFPAGEVRWVGNNDELCVFDNYDIWMLDATGYSPAKNITNGYGRRNGIRFDIVNETFNSKNHDSKLLLVAFQKDTKFNGFFSKDLFKNNDPEKLVLGPYLFYYSNYLLPVSPNMFTFPLKPFKAENKNVWIVKRTGVKSMPNYYVTKDFIAYKPISNIQYSSDYNMFDSELKTWKRADGILNYGILYKPENFDSLKKYPVIISYYAQGSHRLYDFPLPDFTNSAHINIPWFVSRGYLVLTPDIFFDLRNLNESAFRSIKYAGDFLKDLPYVDSSHIGIAGHSRAGQYTNYIITRTGMFAAALEGAGTSDVISSTLQLVPNGEERRSLAEPSSGGTIWDNPQHYISNSAVLSADKVTTPLLIFHCKNDGSVPFQQALEMFLALQRLDKKVWLLDYDNEGHLLLKNADKWDLTVRVTEYFDHYLKGAPAPRWMTQGVPAALKGIEARYELDPSGSCGNDCKVCKEWNEKMKKDPTTTVKELQEKGYSEHWIGVEGINAKSPTNISTTSN